MAVIPDSELQSSSPHLKASEHAGYNKQCEIKTAGTDELNYPGEPTKHGYVIGIGAPKDIWLSKTNLKAIVAQFGNDTEKWVGKKILLTTKEYDIEGKQSVGWITTPMGDDMSDDIPF
jgi:hypothetical protein